MGKKGFRKFLAGAAVGAGLGLLFAPKSGKETREDIKKKCDELLEQLKNVKSEDVKEAITKKIAEIEAELKDLDKEKVLKIAKEKGAKIQKKAEEVYNLAKEKGTPVLEKTAKELKTQTAEVLKKVVAKLEN
jgi:biotin-(acetyl-CoA carboxylase) ligase